MNKSVPLSCSITDSNALSSLEGILLLNKPKGLTSNVALQKVKRLLGVKKAGHTGTLDPMATGMLPICIGDATKFSRYLLDEDKIYLATGLFGKKTDTGDITGLEIATHEHTNIDELELRLALDSFLGESMQIPPMYSALKYQGKAMYKYARDGVEIDRPSRRINIKSIELVELDGPSFTIRVKVSKGTYIRTLLEDIAVTLGTCATMSALHRENTCGFEQEDMVSIEDLTESSLEERCDYLLPIDRAIAKLKPIYLTQDQIIQLYHGIPLTQSMQLCPTMFYALYDEHETLIGVGESVTESQLKSTRLRRRS